MQLMGAADAQQIEIKDSMKKQVTKWFAEEVVTEVDELRAQAEAGFNFKVLFSWFKGMLQTSSTVRREIKLRFEKNISELVQVINTLVTVIEDAAGKEVVVIIDDIDKLDMETVREGASHSCRSSLWIDTRALIKLSKPICTSRSADRNKR